MSDISPKPSNVEAEADFESLRFIRVFTPDHIPRYLMEQVRHRKFDIDEWYEYQKVMCLQKTADGPILNPLNLLYVIATTPANLVVGMLWCVIEPLSKSLVIQTFSIDNLYWHKGKAVRLVEDKAREIQRECHLNKVYWITQFPKHSERYGFKRSRSVLMEYNPREEDDGRCIDGELGQNATPVEGTTETTVAVL